MKKKLAIFTAAIGFFTLCNVVLYTRKLHADEMTIFWRWSLTAAATTDNGSNSSSNSDAETRVVVVVDDIPEVVTMIAAEEKTTGYNSPPGQFHQPSVVSAGQKHLLLSPHNDVSETSQVKNNSATLLTTESSASFTKPGSSTMKTTVTNVTSHSLVQSDSVTFHGGRNISTTTTRVLLPTSSSSSSTSNSVSLDVRVLLAQALLANRTCVSNESSPDLCLQVAQAKAKRTLSVTFSAILLAGDEDSVTTAFSPSTESNNSIITTPTLTTTTTAATTEASSSVTVATATIIGNDTDVSSVLLLSSNKTYQLSKSPGVNGSEARNLITDLNEHNFSYLINVHDLCHGGPPNLTLLILVTTAVSHVAQRQAIRDTWGGMAKMQPDVRFAFVVGRPTDPKDQALILREALLHADILQEDFVDTYKNLTLKSVMLLKWTHTYCSRARYLMKSDDDMFINISNLLIYLRGLRYGKGLLVGRLVRGARPLRSPKSKYYVSMAEYKDKVYPDYLSGTAYVMSADVVPKLYLKSKTVPLFFLEDVFITGICAKKSGIVRRNHNGFVYYKRPVKGCAYVRVISGHDNTPGDLRKIWKELHKKNLKC